MYACMPTYTMPKCTRQSRAVRKPCACNARARTTHGRESDVADVDDPRHDEKHVKRLRP